MVEVKPHTDRTAAGLLEIAQKRMVEQYPFHAGFIAAWLPQATTTIDTIGVTVRNGTILLLFNPAFILSCSIPQLRGVLLHEVHHLLFGHVFIDPAQFSNAHALVIAEEVTANEWIREPLPEGGIFLAQFPQLPPNEDTYTRYQRLAIDTTGTSVGARLHKKPPAVNQKRQGLVPNSSALGLKTTPDEQKNKHSQTLDDHSIWEEARQSSPLARMAVQVLVREVAQSLTAAQRQRVVPAIQQQIEKVCQGNASGALFSPVANELTGQLNWRQLLRRYVRDAVEVRPVFNRPSRRFPALVGIVPGSQRQPQRATVMAVIDTSGSLPDALLESISAELHRMAAHHRVTVVECDSAVHKMYQYQDRIQGFTGRGGTDLRPPFHKALLAKIQPDVIVYFTDGHGEAPGYPPPFPVIWAITPDGQKPAPWGRTLRLPTTEFEHELTGKI